MQEQQTQQAELLQEQIKELIQKTTEFENYQNRVNSELELATLPTLNKADIPEKLDLITPIRRGICHMKGQAFVGNKMVMEGELMAQIVKKNNNEKKTVLKSTKRGNS